MWGTWYRVIAPRASTANTMSHRNSGKPLMSGGENRQKNVTANGTAEANMNGCRRPSRDRQLSDSEPASGSVTASNTSAMPTASPAYVPESPST